MTADDVALLLEVGFGVDDLVAHLTRPATRIEIDREGYVRLEEAGAPEEILAVLDKALPASEAAPMTLEDVIGAVSRGEAAAAIRERILRSESTFEIGIAESLRLSRAGVPSALIKFLISRKKPVRPPAAPPLTPEDIVKRTALGVSPEGIIEAIRQTDSRFTLTTEDLVQLHRDGVDRAVLKEIYRRNRNPETPPAGDDGEAKETSSEATKPDASRPGSTKEDAATRRPSPLDRAAFVLHTDAASRFSMLAPQAFVVSKEFRGRKALTQFIGGDANQELPEMELSVLIVHPRPEERDAITGMHLEPLAERLVADLARRPKSEGIDVVSDAPESTRIAGHEAVRIGTRTVAPSGRTWVGASHLVVAAGRIHVLSYAVRTEMAHAWADRLDLCARSYAVEPEERIPPLTGELAGARSRLAEVFRASILGADWNRFESLLEPGADRLEARLSFTRMVRDILGEGRRIEASRRDGRADRLQLDVFGLDGRETLSFPIVGDPDAWFVSLAR